MRARRPDTDGYIEHEDVEIGYEVYGGGSSTLVLLPTWTIVHCRLWKAQIPYLARHHRVIVFDGPGNGRSDRPLDPDPYRVEAIAGAALAVMDATDTTAAVLVSLSKGANWSLKLAADHPDRVLGQAFIGPSVWLTSRTGARASNAERFFEKLDDPQGWEKYNAHYWLTRYEDFAEFFFAQCFPEAHSTKQREDAVGWAMQTSPEVLVADATAGMPDRDTVLGWCARVDSPVLVIHGSDDRISPVSRGETLADATGGKLVVLEGCGHVPLARDPVKINLALHDFAQRASQRSSISQKG